LIISNKMRIIKVLPSFERTLKKVSGKDKGKLKKSLHQLNNFLISKVLPPGLGLKKLSGNIYELRVDIRLRVILRMEEDVVFLVLVGSHNDIKRYLKNIK